MPDRDHDIVVKLSRCDLAMIVEGLQQSVEGGDTVHVMIQEDGLKFRRNYDTWTFPIGMVE